MESEDTSFIKEITGGICALNNFKASGVKKGKYGFSVIYNPNCTAAAVFTSNKITAAPIKYTKKIIQNDFLSAIIVNSGNANCFTGLQGIKDCESMVDFASNKLNISKEEIAIASTGVIGRKMPLDIILPLEDEAISKLENSPESSLDAAKAIMTTDTFPKEYSIEVELCNGEKVKIAGITKGSGMINPNMGTMLSFIVTDGKIDKENISKSLKKAVDDSYNMIVIDNDESTNDTAILMADGSSNVEIVQDGKIDDNFQFALEFLCKNLAKKMVLDGEGANKLVEVNIKNAMTKKEAKFAAKSVVSSMLFKSAIFGEDPNWGRIVASIGYSGASIDEDKISISIESNDECSILVDNGLPLAFEGTDNLKLAEKIMKNKEIIVNIDLNLNKYSATSWGCDLSYEYVKINGEYTT